jgi:spermidine/putrescine-binding protein
LTRIRILVAAVAAALCVPAAGVSSGSGLPSKIGKGEGQLNLVAWEGYTQTQWVKPFEKATGCKVNAKYAGSSDEMVTLMRQGGGSQYDMVSASGDASLRLIFGKDVQPVNVNLIPDFKNFIPALKSPPHNTIDGQHFGISLQWGPNTLIYNTAKVKPAPKSWSALYSAKYKGKVTVPDNPIQIADAALYLMKTNKSLGITDPYELNQKQFDASVSLLKQQKPLIKKYWALASDEIDLFKNGDAVIREGPREGPDPGRGRDGLGGHVDAVGEGEAPELRVPLDAARVDAEGAGAAGDLLRRDAGEPEGVPDHGQAVGGLGLAVPLRRFGCVLPLDPVLEDAGGGLR